MIRFIRKGGRIIPIRTVAKTIGLASDIAGLGLLAATSIQEIAGKKIDKKKKAKFDIAGLGLLGVSVIAHNTNFIKRIGKLAFRRSL